ncbi:MAG: hypothetical protein HQL17_06380 [Candidatus Omnitrophica bacterium]|nr:hypothetical protein [Candidatus Omnitrophota bacterium]
MLNIDRRKVLILTSVFMLTSLGAVQATPKQRKLYKEVFPDSNPKCAYCHDLDKPRKDGEKLSMNDYGMAIIKAAQDARETKDMEAVPVAETYKKVGQVEDFKK